MLTADAFKFRLPGTVEPVISSPLINETLTDIDIADLEGATVLEDAALSIGDCRVCGWPSTAALSVERLAPPIAFDVHFQDCGVMDEAVDGGERHGLVREDPAPFAEGLLAVISMDRRS